jgi:hypothetical protein
MKGRPGSYGLWLTALCWLLPLMAADEGRLRWQAPRGCPTLAGYARLGAAYELWWRTWAELAIGSAMSLSISSEPVRVLSVPPMAQVGRERWFDVAQWAPSRGRTSVML